MSLLGDFDDTLFAGNLAELKFELREQFGALKDQLDRKADIFAVYNKYEIDNKLEEINHIFNTYDTKVNNLKYKIEQLETKIDTLLEYAALYKNFKN